MEYSLLWSKWQFPSLGITIPASLLSIPKWESASLTNTSKCRESFLHPIFSCNLKYISLAGCIIFTNRKASKDLENGISKQMKGNILKVVSNTSHHLLYDWVSLSWKRCWCSFYCLWLTFCIPSLMFIKICWPCSIQSAYYSKHS